MHTARAYEFGPFRLEPAERRLLRNGQQVPLPPKAFEVLVMLVTRAGHLVTKEELLKEVWPGTFVEEANLSYTVSLLRRALRNGPDDARYIDTVQKLGYRFTAAVRTLAADGVPPQPAALQPAASPHEPPATAWLSPDVARLGPRLRRLRRPLAAAGAAFLGLGLAAVVLYRETREVAPTPIRARFDVTVPPDIILTRFDQPVISPDGRRIAFTGLRDRTRQLWVQPLEGPPAPIALPGTDGAMLPFWSPDSRSVGFFADRKLKRINVDGGPAIILCGGLPVGQAFTAAWARSGVIIFSNGPVYRVADTGGTPEAITRLEESERGHFVRSFLSDDRRFLFVDMQIPPNVYVASLDDPNKKRRLNIGGRAGQIRGVIVSSGHLVYARKGTVVAQTFDEDTLELRGAPVTLAETDGTPWQPRPSASRTGIIVFRSTGNAVKQLTWRGRYGRHLGVIGSADLDLQVDLSPSGTRAILVRGGPWPEDRDLWLADLRTNVLSRLTARPGLESDPAWSPDERRIAYSSGQDGPISPFVKELDTGKEEPLIESAQGLVVDDWTPDGRFLVLRNYGLRVFALPFAGERKVKLLADTPYSEDQLQVSPDGRSIAFNADESDAWQVYVARFPDFAAKRQVSVAGGVQPRWRRDGRELFYLAPDGTMMVLQRTGGETMEFGAARALFKTLLNPAAADWSEYDVTPDGQRFLILEPAAVGPQVFTFVLNWTDGLNR